MMEGNDLNVLLVILELDDLAEDVEEAVGS